MLLSWRQRIAVTFALWLVTFAAMAWFDLGPRPVLLAGLAAVFASALCLLLDISDIATPAIWAASEESESSRGGADVRIRTLQRQLQTDSSIDDGTALHALLVELIDDRLRAGAGIDRRAEPERAERSLGAALTTFVNSPFPPKQIRDPRYLSSILTDIESL